MLSVHGVEPPIGLSLAASPTPRSRSSVNAAGPPLLTEPATLPFASVSPAGLEVSGSQITPCESFLGTGKQQATQQGTQQPGSTTKGGAAAAVAARDVDGAGTAAAAAEQGLPLNVLLAVAVAVLALVVGMMAMR